MSKQDPTGLESNYSSPQAQLAASDAQEEATAGPLNSAASAKADARASGLQVAGQIAQAVGLSGRGTASWGGSGGPTFSQGGKTYTLAEANDVSAMVSGINGSKTGRQANTRAMAGEIIPHIFDEGFARAAAAARMVVDGLDAVAMAEGGVSPVAEGKLAAEELEDAAAAAGGLRNGHLAGDVHPTTGIPFDKNGYPNFSSVTKAEVSITRTVSRAVDFRAANKAAGFRTSP